MSKITEFIERKNLIEQNYKKEFENLEKDISEYAKEVSKFSIGNVVDYYSSQFLVINHYYDININELYLICIPSANLKTDGNLGVVYLLEKKCKIYE